MKENKNAQTETSKKASEKYEKIWELIFWKLTKYWLKVLKVKGFRVWAVSCLISVFSALAAPVALCKLQIQKRRWKPETVFHIVGFSLCSTCSLLCKLLDEWRLGDPPRAHASNLWNFLQGYSVCLFDYVALLAFLAIEEIWELCLYLCVSLSRAVSPHTQLTRHPPCPQPLLQRSTTKKQCPWALARCLSI